MSRIAVSPCSNPELTLEEALTAYSTIGFRHMELFTSWVQSRIDISGNPTPIRQLAERCGMSFISMHLPPIKADLTTSVHRAIRAAEFAQAIGAKVLIYKADSAEHYVAGAGRFLDGVDGLGLTPVLQNHCGTPISTLADFRSIITAINDCRMRALLEVGHFHSAGVPWREAWDTLGERVALVHIKDQIGRQSVPFGKGDIDLPALFRCLHEAGYAGGYVVEMEVEDNENTLHHLADALAYMRACGVEER